MKVTVFGMGYVGLPVACLAAEKGHEVRGVTRNPKKTEMINKGESPIDDEYIKSKLKNVRIEATTDGAKAAKRAEVLLICVPTPVDKDHRPDLSALKSVSKVISRGLQPNATVVVESTVSPETCRGLVKPILEESGLKAGEDFYLAHCPERIDPGNRKWTLEKLPRVIGALTCEGRKKAADFYATILESEIHELSSIEAAEATKIVENAFRDINIAFVNELARSFDKLGIDVIEVIRGASTKPFAFMAHYPGCGVGGHCISVDPYYLIEKARSKGFDHKFLSLAREINNDMPNFTVNKVVEVLNHLGKPVKGTKITVLGLAYKGNVDDTRESPAFEIIESLRNMGAQLCIYDPYLPEKSTVKNLKQALAAECIVIPTSHNQFKEIPPEKFKEGGVKAIIDGRNFLQKEKIESLGIIYKGIGR